LDDAPGGGAIITLTFTPQVIAERAKSGSSPVEQGKLAEDEF
jgi:hypothetical protein